MGRGLHHEWFQKLAEEIEENERRAKTKKLNGSLTVVIKGLDALGKTPEDFITLNSDCRRDALRRAVEKTGGLAPKSDRHLFCMVRTQRNNLQQIRQQHPADERMTTALIFARAMADELRTIQGSQK